MGGQAQRESVFSGTGDAGRCHASFWSLLRSTGRETRASLRLGFAALLIGVGIIGSTVAAPAPAPAVKNPPKPTPPLATLPWKRDLDTPTPVKVNPAVIPWRLIQFPTLVNLPQASLPWRLMLAPAPMDLSVAVIPFAPVPGADRLMLVAVAGDRPLRDLRHIAPAPMDTAGLPLERNPVSPEPVTLAAAVIPFKSSLLDPSGQMVLPLAQVDLRLNLESPAKADLSQNPAAPVASPLLAARENFPTLTHITALTTDLDGNLWIGSENAGVWKAEFSRERLTEGAKTQRNAEGTEEDEAKNGNGSKTLSKRGSGRAENALSPTWSQFTRVTTGGSTEVNGPVLATGTPDEFALGDDNAYALACDGLGRIWVGHLNHGVSVYNGKQWRNYDVLTGPLGERVFDIAVNPADGDVWIATSAGLTRYSVTSDTWSYVTRADGLPSDQIQTLAFAPDGTLFAGTQCEGLAICKPEKEVRTEGAKTQRNAAMDTKTEKKDTGSETLSGSGLERAENAHSPTVLAYTTWQVVQAPDVRWLPPAGDGLPSNIINDVVVSRNGTIYVATTAGLAWWTPSPEQNLTEDTKAQRNLPLLRASAPSVQTNYALGWHYIRGLDWEGKARGLYQPPAAAEITVAGKAADPARLLSEDYVTCLAEDAGGNLWLGHRRMGYEFIPASAALGATGTACKYTSCIRSETTGLGRPPKEDQILALLPLPDMPPLLGVYSRGLAFAVQLAMMPTEPEIRGPGANAPNLSIPAGPATVRNEPPPLPAPARSPSLQELQHAVAQVRQLPKAAAVAAYLGDDWRTQGDWVGRYGRQHAILCAMGSPLNHEISYGPFFYNVQWQIGPHHREKDILRHWVHWLQTDDIRSLYDPVIGYRRQAEWDDHAEAYPMSYEGPDLWISVEVPAGMHAISLYFMNKDGETEMNRFRDYLLTLHTGGDFKKPDAPVVGPELARTRVRDFRGGVYKRFLVTGPNRYLIQVRKNDSFNTICSAVLVDRLSGPKTWMDDMKLPPAALGKVRYDPPTLPLTGPSPAGPPSLPQLWSALDGSWDRSGSVPLQTAGRSLASRVVLQSKDGALAAAVRWRQMLWTDTGRETFRTTMSAAWASRVKMDPALATLEQ